MTGTAGSTVVWLAGGCVGWGGVCRRASSPRPPWHACSVVAAGNKQVMVPQVMLIFGDHQLRLPLITLTITL